MVHCRSYIFFTVHLFDIIFYELHQQDSSDEEVKVESAKQITKQDYFMRIDESNKGPFGVAITNANISFKI